MAMLSRLRRFSVVDNRKSRARLVDLAVDILAGDYPPVTRLFFHSANKELLSLPWKSVEDIDWQTREIKVADLGAGQPVSAQSPQEDVLLNHDIPDALVLDLQNRGATRANDLLLEEYGRRLLLRAADTSFRAILRRLFRYRDERGSPARYVFGERRRHRSAFSRSHRIEKNVGDELSSPTLGGG
jgi:hypothetical protein